MSNKVNLEVTCPQCGGNFLASAEIPNTQTSHDSYPAVRGGMQPIGRILEYRISSEDLKNFIIEKAREYVPDVLIEIAPRYCEKKRKSRYEEHRSYASLRIAFSDNVIKQQDNLGWFGAIGENSNNVKFHEGILNGLINKFKYDRKMVESWLKDYKILEELEDSFGMTEAYIKDLAMYTTPQRVKANSGDKKPWIIFSAAAENVINDFLTDKTTNKVPGHIEIKDVYPISKEIVQFVVYVHPEQTQVRENPHVRQILLGEEKPKK